MKIVHLSTSTSGGAASTAISLSRIQTQFGHDSQVLFRESKLSKGRHIKSKVSTLASFANATTEYAQITQFSSNGINLEKIWKQKPEVIFIHNWFNLLTEADIVYIANRIPTVFVAHDARLATGGCHVTLGCINFLSGCNSCPAARLNVLSRIAKKSVDTMARKIDNFALVAPSNWLMSELTESTISKCASVKRVISNPSTVQKNTTLSIKAAESEEFKILFVAASLDSAYKGFSLFLDSLRLFIATQKVVKKISIQVVGKSEKNHAMDFDADIELKFLGELASPEVHQVIRAADLLVVSSLSENYPGVIGEAQLLGCPVAASRVGGIPEMIEDGVSGFLFNPNPKDCMETILKAMNHPNILTMKVIAHNRALIRHDEAKINLEYNSLIKELLKA